MRRLLAIGAVAIMFSTKGCQQQGRVAGVTDRDIVPAFEMKYLEE